MLVDLARNDLGRVCAPGTVDVVDFMRVERYSHVMHLVSTVVRRAGARAATRSTCCARPSRPAPSRGAPKPRAMEIIESLEPTRRNLYAGTVGYLDAAGDMDMAIAIRTAVLHAGPGLRPGRRRARRRQRPGGRAGRVREQGRRRAARRRRGGHAAAACRGADRGAGELRLAVLLCLLGGRGCVLVAGWARLRRRRGRARAPAAAAAARSPERAASSTAGLRPLGLRRPGRGGRRSPATRRRGRLAVGVVLLLAARVRWPRPAACSPAARPRTSRRRPASRPGRSSPLLGGLLLLAARRAATCRARPALGGAVRPLRRPGRPGAAPAAPATARGGRLGRARPRRGPDRGRPGGPGPRDALTSHPTPRSARMTGTGSERARRHPRRGARGPRRPPGR